MHGRPHILRLGGIGFLLAGIVTTALPFTAAPPAVASVRILVVPGPALVGRPTRLNLQFSVSGPAGTRPVAVTDLLPAGLTYVPGSSRLVTAAAPSTALADPRKILTRAGALMVWPTVRAPGHGRAAILVLAVTASGPRARAGATWTDRATVTAARTADRAPLLTPGGAAPTGAADVSSSARGSVEVVPVSAVQTGRLLASAPGRAAQRLQERLAVTATPSGRTRDVTVHVYLPGTAAWAGCLTPTGCGHPQVDHVLLPVTAARPDLPRPTRVGGVATTPASFTVLTWHLGTLPAGAHRVFTYRLAAASITRARTVDVVTATATPTTATLTTATLSSASGRPGRERVRPDAAVHPVGIRATALQAWPGATPARASVRNGADTTAAATTTTVDPFGTASTTTTPGTDATTTTTVVTSTTTTAAGTTTTTAAKTGLASTGADVARTGEAGLGLTGAGIILLLGGRIRRRRGRDDDAAPGTPSG